MSIYINFLIPSWYLNLVAFLNSLQNSTFRLLMGILLWGTDYICIGKYKIEYSLKFQFGIKMEKIEAASISDSE